ncbi:MAG: transposase [Deltaproteobacteria bacterium]|nr:transposase [Deltaproteobacteria bacterium]
MEVVFRRCCGLDIQKERGMACVLIQEASRVQKEVRTFRLMTADFLLLHDWLSACGVTHVAMGGPGIYWRPLFHLLGGSFTALWLNTPYLKSVAGHREDIEDCEWMANLLSSGSLKESFVSPEPVPVLHDLLRYRKSLEEERVREVDRLGKIMKSANRKLSAAGIPGLWSSKKALLEALFSKTAAAKVVTELAEGPLRDKVPLLRKVLLQSPFPADQRFMLEQVLIHLDFLNEAFGQVGQEVQNRIDPFLEETELLKGGPEVGRRAFEAPV